MNRHFFRHAHQALALGLAAIMSLAMLAAVDSLASQPQPGSYFASSSSSLMTRV